jgi:site-specific DNA-cytosine methylase
VRVLVACEYSGTVRDAFIARGHYALSCDLLPSESPHGPHWCGDVREVLGMGWDLMIAHPPCTHLAVSGARWFDKKRDEQAAALDFVRLLMDAPIERIAIENPVSIISSRIRKPDQIIQPWQHGHEATKTTCLWLKGLPHLKPSNIVGKGARHVTKSGRSLPEWYNLPPSADRWKIRSATFPGIAAAMADQWAQAAS